MPEPPTKVWIAPYLRLTNRVRLGRWEIIPADSLGLDDCASQHALSQVEGLLKLYRRPRGVPDQGFGVFFRHGKELVGESFRPRDLGRIRQALLLGLLDANQTPWRTRPADYNWGHRTSTSDSVFMVGHGVDADGWVSARYGFLVPRLELGLTIKDDPALAALPQSEITPPAEQPFPTMAAPSDEEYMNSVLTLLAAGDDRSARLAATIDWLDLAWRNTISVTEATRILLLKAAFESLLAAGDGLPGQRTALASLLGAEAGRRRWHTPRDRFGNPKSRVQMTDVEWWFSRFTWLRNAIAHGGRTPRASDWVHGRARHFWLADHWLRAAIRAEVAGVTGLTYLRELDPMTRATMKYVHENPGFLNTLRAELDDR